MPTFEDERLFDIASKANATVLILGETGTGKTTLASQIHQASTRKNKPFVAINLATLHEGTLESELFGHERGAFTGADQKRVGRLEYANGGTVFLDEIGELSLRLQARLLDFLQSKVVVAVGSNRPIHLDVRVIAATHRDLPELVRKGLFREDLFHRLRVLTFRLKSLAERSDDFDRILHQMIYEACVNQSRSILRLSEDVARKLESYSWPGNFRELKNVTEFMVLATEGDEIQETALPQWFGSNGEAESQLPQGVLGVLQLPLSLNYGETLEYFEKEYLKRALSRFRGRINRTARSVGINKTTLLRRIRAYQISLD